MRGGFFTKFAALAHGVPFDFEGIHLDKRAINLNQQLFDR